MRGKGHDVIDVYGDTYARYISRFQLTGLYMPALIAVLAQARRPDIVDVHSADGWLLPRRGLVARSHGLEHAHWRTIRDASKFSRRFRWYMDSYRLPAARRAFQRAGAIISPSSSDAASFALAKLDPQPPIEVIPHGLGPEWLASPGRGRRNGAPLRLLFVGDWSYTKGADRLPDLMASLRLCGIQAELTAVTSNAPRALSEPAAAPATPITVVRPTSSMELEQLMRSHDVLVVPSRFEAFGRVVTEAMAVGLMVVATPTGCAPDLIRDGDNGVLADFDDSMAAAQKITAATSRIDSIGKLARESVGHLSWDWVAARTIGVYEWLLASK
jgi:glycosyltransferase involved in cell wall biosynthesis